MELGVTTLRLPEKCPQHLPAVAFLREQPRHSVRPCSLARSPRRPMPASAAALNSLSILCLSLHARFPGEARTQNRRQLPCQPLLAFPTANSADFPPEGFLRKPLESHEQLHRAGRCTGQRSPHRLVRFLSQLHILES